MTTHTLNGTSAPTVATRRPRKPAASDAWQEFANCRSVDPELFFPNGTGGTITSAINNAKKVCASCLVRTECLDWAVETGQYNGVWGGLDEKERVGLYATPQDSFTRCMNAEAWIWEQLAVPRSQKSIARELCVDQGVLSRAIRKMQFERDALAAAGGEGA